MSSNKPVVVDMDALKVRVMELAKREFQASGLPMEIFAPFMLAFGVDAMLEADESYDKIVTVVDAMISAHRV